jgi:hypothetical protein
MEGEHHHSYSILSARRSRPYGALVHVVPPIRTTCQYLGLSTSEDGPAQPKMVVSSITSRHAPQRFDAGNLQCKESTHWPWEPTAVTSAIARSGALGFQINR